MEEDHDSFAGSASMAKLTFVVARKLTVEKVVNVWQCFITFGCGAGAMEGTGKRRTMTTIPPSATLPPCIHMHEAYTV